MHVVIMVTYIATCVMIVAINLIAVISEKRNNNKDD